MGGSLQIDGREEALQRPDTGQQPGGAGVVEPEPRAGPNQRPCAEAREGAREGAPMELQVHRHLLLRECILIRSYLFKIRNNTK